jgi:hypothetical protein
VEPIQVLPRMAANCGDSRTVRAEPFVFMSRHWFFRNRTVSFSKLTWRTSRPSTSANRLKQILGGRARAGGGVEGGRRSAREGGKACRRLEKAS